MMLRQLILLAAYNRQMNRQFYAACAELDDVALREDRGAFFKSIFGTLNHVLLVDRLYLGSFKSQPVVFNSLDEELFDDFTELRRERELTDADIEAWAQGLTEEDLEVPNPKSLKLPLWITATHFFNHQAHHRGQLSALLSQRGIDYGLTDIPWVKDIGIPGA